MWGGVRFLGRSQNNSFRYIALFDGHKQRRKASALVCFEIFQKLCCAHRWENAAFTPAGPKNTVSSAGDLKKGEKGCGDAKFTSLSFPAFFRHIFRGKTRADAAGNTNRAATKSLWYFFQKNASGHPSLYTSPPFCTVLPVSCTYCRYGVIAATSHPSFYPSPSPHPFPLTVNLSYYGAAPPPYLHGIDRSFKMIRNSPCTPSTHEVKKRLFLL